MNDIFFKEIKDVINIQKTTIEHLKRIGILTLKDLLFYKPISYNFKIINPNISDIKDGELLQLDVIIKEVNIANRYKKISKILVSSSIGLVTLVFFNKIPNFIFAKLSPGSKLVIAGVIEFSGGCLQIKHPDFILKQELKYAYEPIYSLTYGITNKQLYGYVINALEYLFNNLAVISDKKNDLNNLINKLSDLHLYKFKGKQSEINFLWENTRLFLAKQELIVNQLVLNKLRKSKNYKIAKKISLAKDLQNNIISNLGFELTSGQKKVIDEIEEDQLSSKQMNRLLQGDVGAGKTLIAMLSIINVVSSGYQAVLLAPTDLLANQHFEFFIKSLKNTKFNITLLVGKTSLKEKKIIKNNLAEGLIDILIGTHALLQDDVCFKKLAYIVIDEQHKFGVEQRRSLINKSSHPDILLMTATPIPRSLTLTSFGDMDISKLEVKPQNRLPISTVKCSNSKINEVIISLAKKINQNEQIFWVCPLIEDKNDNKSSEWLDVLTRYQSLLEYYPNNVGILHGKMSVEEKNNIMQNFKDKKFNILVATTVIEVGIDIPSATLVIIENAEKFGLAQLHQLRGRVGRNSLQSHCILIYNPNRMSRESIKRLDIMKESNDGFYISEQDLLLRGSGDLLGEKQSGLVEFFFADLTKDLVLLEEVNKLVLENNISFELELSFWEKLFSKTKFNLDMVVG